eukprot:3265654-Ditylum_brightwellii.AAC.1
MASAQVRINAIDAFTMIPLSLLEDPSAHHGLEVPKKASFHGVNFLSTHHKKRKTLVKRTQGT